MFSVVPPHRSPASLRWQRLPALRGEGGPGPRSWVGEGRGRRIPSEIRCRNHFLRSRRFAPLFWCQFFSAFNDNFLKNALALLILFKIGGQSGEAAGDIGGRHFYRAVFSAVGLRRRARRSLRQGAGGAPAEARRNRRGGDRRRRFPAELAAIAVPGAVSVRPDRRAVRADQIRHPSRSSEAGGVAGGQRARRRRHVSRDPRRHDRRRLRDEGRRRPQALPSR